MAATCLVVDGESVKSTDVTYDNLVWLYDDFIKRHGRVPLAVDGISKNNLPQNRIVQRVLNEYGITYNDFLNRFGKVSHVRTESNDYDYFVRRFKSVSHDTGRALTSIELVNNTYGLPSASWFVKKCPDNNVHSYNDFVQWCGFSSNSLKQDKNEISDKLVGLEKQLGRPIKRSDITSENVGFSMIVVNRLWGGLNNAKKELGLLETKPNPAKPFSYYKEQLDRVLHEIKKQEQRTCISWQDIENDKYLGHHINHKTYLKSFREARVDFNAYLKSRGFEMSIGGMGFSHTFSDGEQVKSIFEYDFSRFLREELGLVYGATYFRNIKYRSFANIGKKRIDCDYMICIDGEQHYIEVAGMIYNNSDNAWRSTQYASKRENDYRDKMVVKEDLLIKYDKSFLFLFPRDMLNDSYKTKTTGLLGITQTV